MMIMSKPCSKQWWFAFIIFLVQITLLTMILQDQASYDYITTPFDVPYKVSPAVHAGQLLAIMISLATQTDLVIAIITFIMLWSRRRISWTTVAEVAENSHAAIWSLRIAFPLCCKFVEGVLVLLTTFVIVIQSDSMIELFKDFAAMQLISEVRFIILVESCFLYRPFLSFLTCTNDFVAGQYDVLAGTSCICWDRSHGGGQESSKDPNQR